jgi:hypothetical protein
MPCYWAAMTTENMAARVTGAPVSAVTRPREPGATGRSESVRSALMAPEPEPTEPARTAWLAGVENEAVPEVLTPSS